MTQPKKHTGWVIFCINNPVYKAGLGAYIVFEKKKDAENYKNDIGGKGIYRVQKIELTY